MSEPTAEPSAEPSTSEPRHPAPESGRVTALRAELAALDEVELNQHPEVYQRIHADLQDALAGIDDT